MSVGPDCANAVDHSMEDIARGTSLYDAIIEWQGLLGTESFLGSYSSTFSQVLAVHRGMQCAHDKQNRFQAWLAVCWAELIFKLL